MSWITLIIVLLLLWAIAKYLLSGDDLSHFDNMENAIDNQFDAHADDDESSQGLLNSFKQLKREIVSINSLKKGLVISREFADNLSNDLETDTAFIPTTAYGVNCEWAIAQNADSKRRVLLFHGGAFVVGSPKGHRRLADQLSKSAKAAVLSVDYRMLPENGRKASIVDAQSSYQWILKNGPDGPSELDLLLVAGDSAGGNLAMMISTWSRKAARRPDGVIGFSPSLDMTMSSPTNVKNYRTDKVLGQGLKGLIKIPSVLRAWVGLILLRYNPSNPLASPVFGDLKDLPKTLIHASSNEMLLGEAVRYTNRAKTAGSDVRLQVWENQIHDWHLLNHESGSAKEAWAEIEKFINQLT